MTVKRRERGELEAEVMDVLWDEEDWLAPAEVQQAVSAPRRRLAYSTVMTILVRLWKKGLLERRREGKKYLYRPVATREELAAQRMHDLLEQAGDPSLALGHFVDSMNAAETRRLRNLLRRGQSGGRRS